MLLLLALLLTLHNLQTVDLSTLYDCRRIQKKLASAHETPQYAKLATVEFEQKNSLTVAFATMRFKDQLYNKV